MALIAHALRVTTSKLVLTLAKQNDLQFWHPGFGVAVELMLDHPFQAEARRFDRPNQELELR